MKKDYRTPEIEIQAIELTYMLAESQTTVTVTLKNETVGSEAPTLSRTSHESPYQESSFQGEDDWDM